MHSPTSPSTPQGPAPIPRTAANRLGLDYRAEAARLGAPVKPIIDVHAHVVGARAPTIYDQARRLYGVVRTYSMTQLAMADQVRDLLGDSVRFIAFPSFGSSDRAQAFREGYLGTIEQFHTRFGSRMLKLWASPRLRDLIPSIADLPYGGTDLAEVDAPWRIRACEVGQRLGMMYMIHIADPDTWYQTKYNNPAKYGTKRAEYERLERMLDRFPNPWIAAHMGGWPEDLDFLDGMLERHGNLHIDTSATKWVVRELSKHPRERVAGFFTKWRGRLLFGSDIVVGDDHLTPKKATQHPMADLADSPEAAFNLYASRYWALRTMFETGYDGESNIADPDLAMVEPDRFGPMSAPRLQGFSLPRDVLASLYHDAAAGLVERWWAGA